MSSSLPEGNITKGKNLPARNNVKKKIKVNMDKTKTLCFNAKVIVRLYPEITYPKIPSFSSMDSSFLIWPLKFFGKIDSTSWVKIQEQKEVNLPVSQGPPQEFPK